MKRICSIEHILRLFVCTALLSLRGLLTKAGVREEACVSDSPAVEPGQRFAQRSQAGRFPQGKMEAEKTFGTGCVPELLPQRRPWVLLAMTVRDISCWHTSSACHGDSAQWRDVTGLVVTYCMQPPQPAWMSADIIAQCGRRPQLLPVRSRICPMLRGRWRLMGVREHIRMGAGCSTGRGNMAKAPFRTRRTVASARVWLAGRRLAALAGVLNVASGSLAVPTWTANSQCFSATQGTRELCSDV